MLLRLGIAVALLSGGTVLWAQDQPINRLDRVQQAFRKYQEAVNEYRTTYPQSEGEERQLIFERFSEKRAAFGKLLDQLVEDDPNDAAAFRALQILLNLADSTDNRALELLAKHHAANPNMVDMVPMLTTMSQARFKPLLEAVAEKNPDRTAKGWAALGLANLAADSTAPENAEHTQKVITLYKRVIDEFGDVPGLGPETLGAMAEGLLTEYEKLGIGKTAPKLVSTDLEGNPVSLSDLRGRVVVLNFWATWCGPCVAMIPHEREMVEALADKPFTLVSISADEEVETVTKFQKTTPMPWTQWHEGRGGPALREWNIRFYPTIYVLDAEGVIRYKNVRNEELKQAVITLLDEMGAK